MTTIAITIAMTITHTCSTMPMAVMTESSEKTMSMTAMVTMVQAKLAGLPGDRRRPTGVRGRVFGLRLFELLVHLDDALGDQEQPAGEEDEVAPRHFAGVEVVQERHRRQREERRRSG